MDVHFWAVLRERITKAAGTWHSGKYAEKDPARPYYIRVPIDRLPRPVITACDWDEYWEDSDADAWAIYRGRTKHEAMLRCYAAICADDSSGVDND